MQVAGRVLAMRALKALVTTKVRAKIDGRDLGKLEDLERERVGQVEAIEHVIATGEVHEGLARKWRL